MRQNTKWLACQATTSAECWGTLLMLVPLTDDLRKNWEQGLQLCESPADWREIQMHAFLYVVEQVESDRLSTPAAQALEDLGGDWGWKVIPHAIAQELLESMRVPNLEYGASHLELRKPLGEGTPRARFGTAIKHVEADIYSSENCEHLLTAHLSVERN